MNAHIFCNLSTIKKIYEVLGRSALILFSLLIYACGGGGDGGGTTGGTSQVSISSLPSIQTVNENESVTVSLNASGEGSNALSFDWTVRFQNQDISFSGQGNDSITFVAPDVDGTGVVSVNVSIDAGDTPLIGATRHFSSITVLDLDVIDIPSLTDTDLPEVTDLDLSDIQSVSTWRVDAFQSGDVVIEGVDTHLEIVTHQISYLDRNINDEVTEQSCLADELLSFDTFLDRTCTEGETSVNFYQQGDAFRQELRCDDVVVLAANYTKLSDGIRTDFGELSLDFATHNDLVLTEEVCGSVTVTNASFELVDELDGTLTSIEFDTSLIALRTQYEGENLVVFLTLDETPNFGLFPFDSFFNSLDLNSITLFSDALPSLSGVEEGDSGSITIVSDSVTDIRGSLRVSITDISGVEEDLEGDFELRFE